MHSTARDLIVQHLRSHLPGLLAIYAFGSRITGNATPDSDLDLAVLVEGHADIIALFNLSSDLADLAGCDVDLVDLRAASTVMQHQIIQTGVRWWAKDHQADLFEIYVCKEKWDLDRYRAGLLQDIQQQGRIYREGRATPPSPTEKHHVG
jgi:DNA polymerase, beta domain protein region